MKIKFVERRNVTSGRYLAKVTEVADGTVRSGVECIRIKFVPYDDDGDFAPLYLNFEDECYTDSVNAQIFLAVDEEIPEYVTTKQLKDMLMDETVCLVVSDNDIGTKVFHNIVSILSADEYDEEELEDDDKLDEEELEEDDDDDDESDEEELEEDDEIPINKSSRKRSEKSSRLTSRRR